MSKQRYIFGIHVTHDFRTKTLTDSFMIKDVPKIERSIAKRLNKPLNPDRSGTSLSKAL